jgi:hypothetical protein
MKYATIMCYASVGCVIVLSAVTYDAEPAKEYQLELFVENMCEPFCKMGM